MNSGSIYTKAEQFNCLLKCDLSNLSTIERLTQFSHFSVDTGQVMLGGEWEGPNPWSWPTTTIWHPHLDIHVHGNKNAFFVDPEELEADEDNLPFEN